MKELLNEIINTLDDLAGEIKEDFDYDSTIVTNEEYWWKQRILRLRQLLGDLP